MILLKSEDGETGCHYTTLSIQLLFEKYNHKCNFIEKENTKFIFLPLHAH
jgi:hypothetical protein